MMDKIYSRKKIRLSKENVPLSKNNYIQKIKVIAIFVIAFTVLFGVNNSINPIYHLLAKNQAKVISTEILNTESKKILTNIKYEDLVKIERDDENNINMLKFDVIKMNLFASDIAYNVQEELNKKEEDIIKIPIGSLFGIKYLFGFGPKIKLKIIPAGNIETEFKSNFESVGINQTIHRIYLNVICKVNIVSRI